MVYFKKFNIAAFTLLEMSIVLTIISFLAGSIMYATNLINRAKLDTIIADVKRFTKAASEFEQRYGGLPGDLADISRLPTASPALVTGNGNGIIDSSEELQFWRQLYITNMIKDSADGSSTYVPSKDLDGGVPAGNFANSGYKVRNYSTYGLIIDFSAYSLATSNNSLPVLNPDDAFYLDNKYDDGNPLTGAIIASDGSGIAAGNCVSSSSYNLNVKTETCILTFVINPQPNNTTPTSTVTCTGSSVGTNRISSTQTCPAGYQGYVIDTCSTSGTWVVARQLCEIIKCSDNANVSETRRLKCPDGYTGYLTQTCQSNGVWQVTSNNCTATTSCTGSSRRILPCPIGYTGYIEQNCSSSTWSTTTNSCSAITCSSGENIGANKASSSVSCPANYSSGTPATVETCTLPLTGSTGTYRVTSNNCMPDYGSGACTASTTRTLNCPPGQQGSVSQTCNSSGYWENTSYTCSAVKCGNDPIGSTRIAAGKSCPLGTTGVVLEVCDYTDTNYNNSIWKTSTSNCANLFCPAKTNASAIQTEGYAATWDQTMAGQQATIPTNGTCYSGYGIDSTNPSRYCGFDGTWQDADYPCLSQTCPAESDVATNTYWGAAVAGYFYYIAPLGDTTNNNGVVQNNYCLTGYIATQYIVRECVAGSGWAAPSGSCVLGGGGVY